MGIVVLLAGNLPWGVLLVPLNLRVARVVPSAVLPMAIYPWCYWKHIGGSWGSKATAGERRANLRAIALSVKMWGASLGAGLLGFATIAVMLVLMSRLTNLPSSAPLMAAEGMPSITMFVSVVMSSVVAGIREVLPSAATCKDLSNGDTVWLSPFSLTGRAFGLLHFPNHPADVWIMLPYYIAVSAVYGGRTWAATRSCRPWSFIPEGCLVTRPPLVDRPAGWQLRPHLRARSDTAFLLFSRGVRGLCRVDVVRLCCGSTRFRNPSL